MLVSLDILAIENILSYQYLLLFYSFQFIYAHLTLGCIRIYYLRIAYLGLCISDRYLII